MRVIDDDSVRLFFQHPSAKRIMGRWFSPYRPSMDLSDEENYLNFLKFVMVTGMQDEFYKRLNEPHQLMTSHGLVDFNHIAKVGNKHLLDPAIQYIENENLVFEATSKYNINDRMNRLLVYTDNHDKMRHFWIDCPADWRSGGQVIYKKIHGILYVNRGEECRYANSHSDIVNVIASKPADASLINMETL